MPPRLSSLPLLSLLSASWLFGLCASSAAADIYSFTDEQGVIHLSTMPYERRFGLMLKDVVEPKRSNRGNSTGKAKLPSHPLNGIIKEAAELHQLDEALLHAVIKAESGYNPDAVSRKGAIGLMQIMPGTAKAYGVTNPRNPAENLRGGAMYLRELLQVYDNDLTLALAAYNAGKGAVARYGNTMPPYRETQAYVPKVLQLYERYAGCGDAPCLNMAIPGK